MTMKVTIGSIDKENPYKRQGQQKQVSPQSIPQEQLQSVPIGNPTEQNPYDVAGTPSSGKLQHMFELEDIKQGGKLRVITTPGELYDVVWDNDGRVTIQQLLLKVQYGNKSTYQDFATAQKALETAGNFEVYSKLSKKILAELIKKIAQLL